MERDDLDKQRLDKFYNRPDGLAAHLDSLEKQDGSYKRKAHRHGVECSDGTVAIVHYTAGTCRLCALPPDSLEKWAEDVTAWIAWFNEPHHQDPPHGSLSLLARARALGVGKP